jgi:hypothetical protein
VKQRREDAFVAFADANPELEKIRARMTVAPGRGSW